jgi:hypothetical protein
VRSKCRVFLMPALLVLLCLTASGQGARTITVRLLDSKTGQRLTPSGLLVRINHETAEHVEWARANEDGTWNLTVPEAASVVLVHFTYDSSMNTYVNCDADKRYQSASPRWYAISEIVDKGIVTSNGCIKPSQEEKLKAAAKPGEAVFYVRKQNWREGVQD